MRKQNKKLVQVCAFLAPLLQKGLVRAHAEAVCDLPSLGVFAEVPLMLSIVIGDGIFALDLGAAEEHLLVLVFQQLTLIVLDVKCNLPLCGLVCCSSLEINSSLVTCCSPWF